MGMGILFWLGLRQLGHQTFSVRFFQGLDQHDQIRGAVFCFADVDFPAG